MNSMDIGTFAGVGFSLLVAHSVADHWVQTGHQACNKGLPGWPGRRACAAHVASYTLCTALAVGAVWALLRPDIAWLGFVLGQLVSAVTHYWADRRFTLKRLAGRLGKSEFYELGSPRQGLLAKVSDEPRYAYLTRVGSVDQVTWDNPSLGTGAYALDQSWHWLWLGVAAMVTTLV